MPMTSTTSHNPNANIRTVDKKSSTTTTNTTNSSIIGSIPTSTLGLAAAATAERIQKMTQATASSTNSVTTGGGERKKSRVPAKVPLKDINEFLMCQLCFGYLIEATAIVECQDTCKLCFHLIDCLFFLISREISFQRKKINIPPTFFPF